MLAAFVSINMGCLLITCLVSLNSALFIVSVYKSCTSFVKFILKYVFVMPL